MPRPGAVAVRPIGLDLTQGRDVFVTTLCLRVFVVAAMRWCDVSVFAMSLCFCASVVKTTTSYTERDHEKAEAENQQSDGFADDGGQILECDFRCFEHDDASLQVMRFWESKGAPETPPRLW